MSKDYSKNYAGNRNCLEKAKDGEPMFIILGRDPDGAHIVRQWADRRLAAGGDPEHCKQVHEIADAMEEWSKTNKPDTAPDKKDYPAMPVPSPWRDIDSAPKDGTRCLFFAKANKQCFYKAGKKDQIRVDFWKDTGFHKMFPQCPYTHWTPLPEAPESPPS